MNSRQRFIETMNYGTPDRVPYFEEGLRDEVLEAWRSQGLPPDADLSRMFHTDHREEVELDIYPHPEPARWPTSRRGLDLLRRSLDPDDPLRWPNDWTERVRSWRSRQHVLKQMMHRGFFKSRGVGDWSRFYEVMELVMDDPVFVHEVLDIHAELSMKLAERVLREVEIDAAVFSEPIGGNNGPLISPRMFEEFVLASYQPVLEVLKRYGVKTVILRTYANARALVPSILKMGFNCLWACEVNIEAMDYGAIRGELGRDLRLIGGIDLDALRFGKDAIRREVEEKVPLLVAEGGYVPLADGRVREDVTFENYVYYRRLLEEVTRG